MKGGKGQRLMGFGHRVYKSYDPRAKIVKKLAYDVFKVTGMDKDLEIALELERIALADDYFVSRKLYPNVDFYTGLIYRAMKFPTDYFTVLFAVARTAGWLAQWEEMLLRQGAEDRASAADLHRVRRAAVQACARPIASGEEVGHGAWGLGPGVEAAIPRPHDLGPRRHFQSGRTASPGTRRTS